MILKIDLWLLGFNLLNFKEKLSDDEESESESEEEEENSKKGDFIKGKHRISGLGVKSPEIFPT